ncbi:MAG: hypothetical protein AB2693_15440 [Candidatus Thiodiazotropha sp.]
MKEGTFQEGLVFTVNNFVGKNQLGLIGVGGTKLVPSKIIWE